MVQCYPLYTRTESDVSPTMTWALAAIYAHRAYDNQSLLNLSTQVWEQQNKFVVPSQFIQRSQVPGTNVSLAENLRQCDYCRSRDESELFVKSHMFNGTVVIDRVDMHSCDKVAHEAVTYDSGLFIEGLSVYSNQSDQTNAMWAPFLDQVVQEAVVFSGWTGPDGINFEYERGNRQSGAQIGLRSVFIRGLFEAWSRMDQTSSTARLVESYVIVQYNALLDFASNRSNLYSPLWHGPPATALTPQGQLAALDTLNSAAGLGAPILLSSR
ncbi:hypothetical protein EW026_g1856 [Hermanssonia centrifuga]|uniref:Uncharacterized protein n=1 Tax=Hermanssonia centrifuga TaxID=98765 RepID=A0A4S4KQ44_9APHY|nr:hypothetical protein EW026_g1856 [Hermanssonia centrifuga]